MSPVSVAVLAVVAGAVVAAGGAVALALGWAARSGQFENVGRGARSIFGPDEPVGEPTDRFPGPAPDGPA